jgi:hypothetical protein
MAVVDCSVEMGKFHSREVTLSRDEQGEMRRRRDDGRTRVRTGLDADKVPQPQFYAAQGSYSTRTMAQDPKCDYDIDDGVYFSRDDLKTGIGGDMTPLAARERVAKALRRDGRLKHEAEIKTNCVRQLYPEGYHIDIPVYRIHTRAAAGGNTEEFYELAGGDAWSAQDARAVTKWFNDMVPALNEGQDDGSQMRRLVRLVKKFARSREDWKASTTTGICMTKLVVDHFSSSVDRDDEALYQTMKAILSALQKTTQIKHPIQEANLADAGDAKVIFFRGKLDWALGVLNVLEKDTTTAAQARTAWDSVFNTTFFSDNSADGSGGGGKGRAFTVTSTEAAKRNDNGRRFG